MGLGVGGVGIGVEAALAVAVTVVSGVVNVIGVCVGTMNGSLGNVVINPSLPKLRWTMTAIIRVISATTMSAFR